MHRSCLFFILSISGCLLHAQHSDTLRFRSAAFGEERELVVHLPEFHRYAAPEVRMPVIIVLDGQHEWFIDPVLNDIRSLQYTHAVPQAIVVTVPHTDRVAECAPDSIGQVDMPLLRMLAEELPVLLQPYHPGDYRVLVGHSFSASFALYAYLKQPEAFDAVIALSPLHLMNEALPQVVGSLKDRSNDHVLLALGGAERLKDGGHYARVEPTIRALGPDPVPGRFIYQEYPSAGHTSLPIIAFPELTSTLFSPYALRDSLAPVDDNYELREPPPPPEVLLQQVVHTLGFSGSVIPWDVAEINGLASRLWSSGHEEQVRAVYERAVELYPVLYEFHWSLGESLLEVDRHAAMRSLNKALELLDTEEADLPQRMELRAAIEALMR
ncbi:MAG: hypothetical protein KDC00_02385 [Flavobacteriales bacterium]|nr:hypothetical protein [Flavobacteriales bacterium]